MLELNQSQSEAQILSIVASVKVSTDKLAEQFNNGEITLLEFIDKSVYYINLYYPSLNDIDINQVLSELVIVK